MNFQMIFHVLGLVLGFEGCFLLVPSLTAAIYGEREGIAYFVMAVICLVTGAVMTLKKPRDRSIYAKEGFAAVALSWLVISAVGALPFTLSREIPSYIDALFELISGVTTTGASILTNVEAMSHTGIIWRCFSHWFGGMGVLVFILAVMPMTGGSTIHLMRAESPGPSVEKLVPKMKRSALILYGVYICLTIIQLVLLLFGGLSLFEALNITFATAGTGGFAIRNSSFAQYSAYVQYVTSIFMILFGINFNVYFFMLMRKFKTAFSFEEMWQYLGIIAVAVLAITYNIRHLFPTLEEAFRSSLFQVSTIITTTGFATTNYDVWPAFSKMILLMLMFIGACAGSTGGGIKVSRIALACKGIRTELRHASHPNSVRTEKYNGNLVSRELLHSVYIFLAAYALIYGASLLLLSLNGYDFETNFTAVAATLNNVGPGFSKVGPSCNYAFLDNLSKIVLMFDMLAGRLEVFPMLLVCSVRFWKDDHRVFHRR